MRVLGIVGWSGSGKTTLITALIPLLQASGTSVSTIKHAHHGFDLDRPGKDSYRHRAAGAHEVLIASTNRWALLHENDDREPDLDSLLARLSPVDLVLVEGFKAHAHPKVEVHRLATGHAPLWIDDRDIVAVASDTCLPSCDRPVLPLNDAASVTRWLLAFMGARRSGPALPAER